jgi:hypothetical protein
MESKMTQCPKCKSNDVFVCRKGVGWDVRVQVEMNGMTPTANWTTYLCANCGYFENYVTEKEWLNKIKSDPKGMGWQKSE